MNKSHVRIKQGIGITELDPREKLLDPELISAAVVECLIDNDPEGAAEVIECHLQAMNQSWASAHHNVKELLHNLQEPRDEHIDPN